MKSAVNILLLGLAVISICEAAVTKSNKPAGIECISNDDCSPGHCCTIGYERYSYPTCNKLRVQGDICRPGRPLTTNGTYYYPDSTKLVLKDVHLMLCPCSPELSCEAGTCRESNELH